MKIENGEKIIDDKKVCIIIKQFLPDVNQNFLSLSKNNKNFKLNSINEEPNIENIEGTKYFYYNNFEIIDEDIYELLIKNDDYANYQECTFENNYMYFNVDDIFCKNKSTINIEICALNQNTNSFSANFIIENYYSSSFRKFLKIAEKSGGLDKCLKSYEHNKLVEELIDNSTGQTIGLIYNLLYNNLFNNNNNFNNNANKNLSNYNNNIIKSIYPIILSICKINKLANYFSGNHEFNNNNKQSLTNLLKKISEKNNNNNENPIKNYKAEINEVINKLYPRLNDKNKIVEPKEFILFAISQLHKELNKASNVNINMINNNQDQTNQLAMFKIFAEKFQKENRSIISDLFYGTFHIEIKCARCGIIKHNFEIFSNLIFDLEAVKQNKIDVMMNLMNFNQPINNQQMQLIFYLFKIIVKFRMF